MKKIILILTLTVITSATFAQTKEDYKNYKACTECFDKWNNSSSGTVNLHLNKPKKNSNSEARQFFRRLGVGVVGIVSTAVLLTVYQKTYQATNAIH